MDAKLSQTHSYTVQRHFYDIDVFEILDELRKKISSPGNENWAKQLQKFDFIKADEDFLISDMRGKGIDLMKNQENRNYILPSSSNSYLWYLGWKLLVVDVYKVEAVLSYQATLYKGNYYAKKGNFLGLIEFLIYDFMNQRDFTDKNIRLERVMNWVERNRNLATKKKKPDGFKPPEFLPLTIDHGFANILCEKLALYFVETQQQQLFNAIAKGEINRGLCFNGKMNSLVELFKRLRYNKKMIVKSNTGLAQWLTAVFCVKDESGNMRELNYNTTFDILKRTRNEPAKGNRILEEIAPYITLANRKDLNLPRR